MKNAWSNWLATTASRALIDTNILVYAYAGADLARQPQALEVMRGLSANGNGVLSAQVLAEFISVTTRKRHAHLTVVEAEEQVHRLVQTFEVLSLTAHVMLEAARGTRQHQMAIWDAIIWATARLNQVPVVLSEDFHDGAVIEGVRFINPFAAAN